MPPRTWATMYAHALDQLHAPRGDEAHGDRRVDVAARDRPDGVDQGDQDEPEGEGRGHEAGREAARPAESSVQRDLAPEELEAQGLGGHADGDDHQDCRTEELRQELLDVGHAWKPPVSRRGIGHKQSRSAPHEGRGYSELRRWPWPVRPPRAAGWPWRPASCRESAGTASSTPLNWRCPSTRRLMSVSDTTVAERGRRSSNASSPKYWPGPRVATLRLLRRTEASPLTMRKNSRPMVPCSHSTRPGGTVTSSSALRTVRRSLADEVEKSQILDKSRSLCAMGENSSPQAARRAQGVTCG